MSVRILIGDMRERLRELGDASVDSCVCDPPYHLTSIVKRLGASSINSKTDSHARRARERKEAYGRLAKGFMGQTWDGGAVAFDPETWAEVLRVLKPGAHLIAFSGTRTYHRMACAIEDAGFEIRDQLAWVYGSGFPKSHNQPGGWGTALKPAWEPIALARKPLIGTVAANVLAHGTGALNIDGCRIDTDDALGGGAQKRVAIEGKHEGWARPWMHDPEAVAAHAQRVNANVAKAEALGRWPANIIHDGSEEVLAGFPAETGNGYRPNPSKPDASDSVTYGMSGLRGERGHDDSGSAARFFYCAKATSEERGEGNNHPTVKPVDLMRWLCRLVTPKGGTVLDPFAGSGSTLIAADAEQFNAIGCELSPDYAAIAESRLRASAGMFAEVQAA